MGVQLRRGAQESDERRDDIDILISASGGRQVAYGDKDPRPVPECDAP